MSLCDQGGLLEVEQAIKFLCQQINKPLASETISLTQALDRVLFEDQYSAINVPDFDNSAMDGYAINTNYLSEQSHFLVSQRIIAGDSAQQKLATGTCARIFTGAVIPQNANAVVMQEQCQVTIKDQQQWVSFPKKVIVGQNIRACGQDIKQQQKVLSNGTKLRAQELGLLASIGIKEVNLYKKLRVAIISTGNELLEPGQQPQKGKIFNSNHYSLSGLIRASGFEVIDCGTVPDDPLMIEQALLSAASKADCIITSGGVSVGDEDHVKSAVKKLGEISLWKIAIKPGKPFAFGHVNNTPFLGLPGNPAAVLATFSIIAKPYLYAMQGICEDKQANLSISCKADFVIRKKNPREQYLMVRAKQRSDGSHWLVLHPNQSSGVLSSSCWATGMAKIAGNRLINKGDLVDYLPFN